MEALNQGPLGLQHSDLFQQPVFVDRRDRKRPLGRKGIQENSDWQGAKRHAASLCSQVKGHRWTGGLSCT
eukprot:4396023-Prymnesium_polylepis.1